MKAPNDTSTWTPLPEVSLALAGEYARRVLRNTGAVVIYPAPLSREPIRA